MDGEQSFNTKDERQLERAWTIDEIRKNSANWTLAGDVGLYNLLNEFSHNIISRTHEVENAVDSLVHQTKMASVKVNNIINDFHMLSNLQFVENRVYDEGAQETVYEEKSVVEKTKEQKEAEMLPKLIKAIDLGLTVLDLAFDKINVNEISDSDEEDLSSEGRTILEPKDPYEHRPLPFIIGSEEFQNCDYAGLKDLVEEEIESSIEEESSPSESDEASSDEGESLPPDEDKFSVIQNRKVPAQSISDRLSSSDESELFGSEKEENGFLSDSSFENKRKESKNIQRPDIEVKHKVKETRQNSISSLQSKLNLPQVLPVPKVQERKKKEDDLFTNNQEYSDDESPFRKRDGLFASDIRFSDEKNDMFDGDLFGESTKEIKKVPATESPKSQVIKTASSKKENEKNIDLFGNDEDSEDDIFNTLIKTKKPSLKEFNTESQDSSEKAESLSTPSSAPSLKQSENAFDFVSRGSNADLLFGDESDADDLFSSKNKTKKFDFDASGEDDDLFGLTKNKNPKQPEISDKGQTSEKKKSLFEDSGSFKPPAKVEAHIPSLGKVKDSLFEDSENSDQEISFGTKPAQPSSVLKVKSERSLFDDDEEDDDDFFSQVNKKSLLTKNAVEKKPDVTEVKAAPLEKKSSTTEKKSEPNEKKSAPNEKKSAPSENKPVESIFDEPDKNEVKYIEPSMQPKTKESKLFSDEIEESEEFPSVIAKIKEDKKPLSLFEDSDSYDLFAPKSTEIVMPKKELVTHQDASETKPTEFDESDEKKSEKRLSPIPKLLVAEESGIDFDTPIDSSKTLNALSKDRVKVATKRRLPSRKSRLAALDNSGKESEEVIPVVTPAKNIFNAKQDEDIFTEQPKKVSVVTSYKAQEKKKMNLMSQLISEVSASKVGKKHAFSNDIDDDDEVDIFAEAANKSEAKRQSFSFLPPKENSIDSGFPSETKENSKTDSNNTEIDDSDNEDFFTEPSFKSFRSSVSHVDSVLGGLDGNEDEDDDLFSADKSNILPRTNVDAPESNDLFDDSDIFADIQKEKYEMFPSQLYDEDEDIFGSTEQPSSDKGGSFTNKNNATIKKVQKQQVNAFEDPLTGLLGDD